MLKKHRYKFHCLPNVIETKTPPRKISPNLSHSWGEGVGDRGPRWRVVTLSPVFLTLPKVIKEGVKKTMNL